MCAGLISTLFWNRMSPCKSLCLSNTIVIHEKATQLSRHMVAIGLLHQHVRYSGHIARRSEQTQGSSDCDVLIKTAMRARARTAIGT